MSDWTGVCVHAHLRQRSPGLANGHDGRLTLTTTDSASTALRGQLAVATRAKAFETA